MSLTESHTPPPLQTLDLYKIYIFTQGRGNGARVEPERRGEGQQGREQVTKLG